MHTRTHTLTLTLFPSPALSKIPVKACTVLNATALIPGHAKLTISYDNGDIHLEASITISSYLPLRPVDPVSVAVVTLGSSKTVLVEGGPSPWVLDPSQFHKSCECHVTCASHPFVISLIFLF